MWPLTGVVIALFWVVIKEDFFKKLKNNPYPWFSYDLGLVQRALKTIFERPEKDLSIIFVT
ncbi:MAG: hypothetical protein ACK5VV_00800, partial [Lysobacteraceae bacterium]